MTDEPYFDEEGQLVARIHDSDAAKGADRLREAAREAVDALDEAARIIRTYVPHSKTTLFYDPDQDFGTSTHDGRISIDVRGSSELKDMDKDRVLALVVLLAKGLDEVRER